MVSFISQGYQQELSDFHDWLSPIPQESKGYEFESETDTETIAKLVKYMYDNRESEDLSFATLVERVTQQLVRACSSTELLLKLSRDQVSWPVSWLTLFYLIS